MIVKNGSGSRRRSWQFDDVFEVLYRVYRAPHQFCSPKVCCHFGTIWSRRLSLEITGRWKNGRNSTLDMKNSLHVAMLLSHERGEWSYWVIPRMGGSMSHPGDARKKSDAILEEGRCKVGRFCTRNNGFFGFFCFLCLFHFLHLEDWVAPHVPVIH